MRVCLTAARRLQYSIGVAELQAGAPSAWSTRTPVYPCAPRSNSVATISAETVRPRRRQTRLARSERRLRRLQRVQLRCLDLHGHRLRNVSFRTCSLHLINFHSSRIPIRILHSFWIYVLLCLVLHIRFLNYKLCTIFCYLFTILELCTSEYFYLKPYDYSILYHFNLTLNLRTQHVVHVLTFGSW